MFESLIAAEPGADAGADAGGGEAALIARITELERVKAAAAAEQARVTVALESARRADEAARGVPAAQWGRGLAAEVALARADSPQRGNRHLGFAKALVHEMPHTLAALGAGALSERRATLIVRESACLDVADRRLLDAELCADAAGLTGWGDRRIAAKAKEIAYRLDPHAVVDRAARAPQDRRVTIRPAPETMTYIGALLPLAHGVSVYAALKRAADQCCDGRSRGQVMADTLVERITGRPAEVPVPVAVHLVIPHDALLRGAPSPARIPGYGPVPAATARELTIAAATDTRSRATLRRLFTHPRSGQLLTMESRARQFPKGLAQFIALRDDTCRTPYCDAPIRHTDHATPAAHGGPTSALNGQGNCEACNYTKETPGWTVTTTLDSEGTHTADYTTPTGTTYHSTAPPLTIETYPGIRGAGIAKPPCAA